jgi:dTDP-4-amino-4,6-dideoxygalactose transaminase
LIEAVKGVFKFTVIIFITYSVMKNNIGSFLGFLHADAAQSLSFGKYLMVKLGFSVLLGLGVIALMDFGWEKWSYRKKMMMTKQEAKQESKEKDGNPEIKNRIRTIQRQMAQKRMMNDVKKADVIVTNPTHISVALRYDGDAMVAPSVLAKGADHLALRIREIAKENDILLIEDCCEAHGATFNNQKVGTFGDISIFSFYFGHHITTIEGGMICTNNEQIYESSKLFRSHGMTREVSEETQSYYRNNYPELNPMFTFAVAGFNMRSTEINAVLGIEQMKRIDYNIERRRHNLSVWLQNLDKHKFYTDFDIDGNSSFALPLIMKPEYKDRFHINDDYSSVCDVLDICEVEYRLGTAGGGNQANQPYLDNFPFKISGDLDVVNYIHSNSLYIGNHTDLTDEQIINLVKKLNDV